MNRWIHHAALAGLLLLGACLAGCANPPAISANPIASGVNDINAVAAAIAPNSAPAAAAAIQTGLLNAEWNLDQAIKAKVLPASDPADLCLHQVNTQLGIEPAAAGAPATPVASFVPRETGLIDTGSVVYIQIQQAKQVAAGGVAQIPPGCTSVVGMLVIDAASVGIKGLPGGNLLPNL
jgi:hypothetical protein